MTMASVFICCSMYCCVSELQWKNCLGMLHKYDLLSASGHQLQPYVTKEEVANVIAALPACVPSLLVRVSSYVALIL